MVQTRQSTRKSRISNNNKKRREHKLEQRLSTKHQFTDSGNSETSATEAKSDRVIDISCLRDWCSRGFSYDPADHGFFRQDATSHQLACCVIAISIPGQKGIWRRDITPTYTRVEGHYALSFDENYVLPPGVVLPMKTELCNLRPWEENRRQEHKS